MKPIASESITRLGLNKRTVAALNLDEMMVIDGGKDSLAAANTTDTETQSLIPTCITYDTTQETGITPTPNFNEDNLGAGGA